MTSALTFSATELAPRAGAMFRLIGNITPDDSEAGGFAKLMRATLPDGTLVAIKRFHRHPGNGEDLTADGTAAKREFDCLCTLDGANGHAPRAFALGTCTDKQGLVHHAIAMEYIEGMTVEQALGAGILSGNARQGDKTHTIMTAARHIMRAIAACDARVVHRDISPANVMLVMNSQGRVKRAVIIDWGQSISTHSPNVTPHLGEGRKLATFYFGAPCVFGGPYYNLRNNPSVDIYSFGALLYYMRLRRLPFENLATGGLMTPERVELIAAQKNAPLSLSDAMPSMRPIERELDRIIAACTSYDPADRPTSGKVIAMISDALGIDEEDAEDEDFLLTATTSNGATPAAAPLSEGARTCEPAVQSRTPEESLVLRCLEELLAATSSAASAKCAPEIEPLPEEPVSPEKTHIQQQTTEAQVPENEPEDETPESLFALAMNAFYGHAGMERSAQDCLRKLEQAANAGSIDAMFTLGRHLTLGIGCDIDEARGTRWLQKARDMGHPGAAAMLHAS